MVPWVTQVNVPRLLPVGQDHLPLPSSFSIVSFAGSNKAALPLVVAGAASDVHEEVQREAERNEAGTGASELRSSRA